MKRLFYLVLSQILLLSGFASAAYYGYGGISLGDLLYSIDESTIVLGAIFMISFAIVFFSTSNFFKENRALAATVAFGVSLLVIYAINKSGFGYIGLFNGFFFFLPPGFIETFWPLAFIGILVLCTVKLGFLRGLGVVLLGTGVILMFASFTGIIYEASLSANTGIFLAIVGAVLFFLGKNKKHDEIVIRRK